MSRIPLLGCVALIAAFAAPVFAQDDLAKFRNQNLVEAQRISTQAKAALTEANRLQKSDPDLARRLLVASITDVEQSTVLSETERGNLLTQLRARLRLVDDGLRQQNAAAKDAAQREADKTERTKPTPQQNPPINPGATAKDFIDRGKQAVNAEKNLNLQKERGSNAVAMDILKTASDLDPQRITPAFIASAERGKPKMTKAEIELLKVLNSTMSVDFPKGTTLEEAVKLIQDKAKDKHLNLAIFFDENSLKEAMVEYSDPISPIKGKDLTVRTILKRLFADRGLTFVIKEAAVQVVTPAKASQMHVTRVYPLDGILPTMNPQAPPIFNRVMMLEHARGVIQLIIDSVEPGSWIPNGGTGSITFHEASRSLIIRNSAEMHYQLGNSFSR